MNKEADMPCIYGLTEGFVDDNGKRYPSRMRLIEVANIDGVTAEVEQMGQAFVKNGDDTAGRYTLDGGFYVDYAMLKVTTTAVLRA
jgi:hypothetical protein